MLRIEGLSKSFPQPFGEVQALRDINLEVEEGEFLAVVGPSGCGKTTLLKVIAGLMEPSSGRILIHGTEVTGPSARVGLVFQESALFPWRTVRENIEFGLELKGVPEGERRRMAMEFAARVGLSGFEDAYPKTLSGGMAQRAAIALINDPAVLLMDEPFGSLDAQLRNRLQEFLVGLWERTGKTIVFVTHNVDEAVFLADRVAVLSRRPGEVKAVFEIELPRPRDRTDHEFVARRREILALMER
ncbi:MAG: ABC transporter ATP-binding protein [Euryarchaeota archaeon]|nr:ABC transporter ATP-binding protein [Euryarchaeota archaeon]